MNYGMIATGNHCNSDSLRGAPLPAVKSSDIAPHFGKNVLLYGSHEWLPYSKDEVRLINCKHQFVVPMLKKCLTMSYRCVTVLMH